MEGLSDTWLEELLSFKLYINMVVVIVKKQITCTYGFLWFYCFAGKKQVFIAHVANYFGERAPQEGHWDHYMVSIFFKSIVKTFVYIDHNGQQDRWDKETAGLHSENSLMVKDVLSWNVASPWQHKLSPTTSWLSWILKASHLVSCSSSPSI